MTIAAVALAWMLSAGAPAVANPELGTDFAIGPEDVLEISVWNNTEISRTVVVRPDGKISLPLVNDVEAAGRTPVQLRDALVKLLATYIPSPIVAVIVREIHSFKVTVIGEVKTPGRYELRSRTTVLDVLAMAGGFTQYASRGRITVLRRIDGAVQELPYDFDKIAGRSSGRNLDKDNFAVQPGDIIVVP